VPRVARAAGGFGEITILRSRAGNSRIYMQGEGLQSHVDRDGVSLSYYIHALYGLAVQTRARDVLMIGCGGGTLGTMLARIGRNVTAVDVDAVSFDLARAHFALHPAVRCRIADGAVFLRGCRGTYGVIVVDAFMGDKVPTHLQSVAFFRSTRRRLGRSGHVMVNVLLGHDRDAAADAIASGMAAAGFRVQVLDTPGEIDRNAIVIGSLAGGLEPPALLVQPRLDRKRIAGEIEELRFRPWRRRFHVRSKG
jgi:spermidine synthase